MEQPDFDTISEAIMSPVAIEDKDDNIKKWKAAIIETLDNVWDHGVTAGGREVLRLIDEYKKAEKADLETINHPEG